MLSSLKAALALLALVQAIVNWLTERGRITRIEKAMLARSLLAIADKVADAQEISNWVAKQPPSVVNRVLRDFYTRAD